MLYVVNAVLHSSDFTGALLLSIILCLLLLLSLCSHACLKEALGSIFDDVASLMRSNSIYFFYLMETKLQRNRGFLVFSKLPVFCFIIAFHAIVENFTCENQLKVFLILSFETNVWSHMSPFFHPFNYWVYVLYFRVLIVIYFIFILILEIIVVRSTSLPRLVLLVL